MANSKFMKQSILVFIFILLSGQIIALNTKFENNDENLLRQSDSYTIQRKNDTTIISYKSFKVIKTLIEVSEQINIIDIFAENIEPIFSNDNYYFLGIKNDRYAIFDKGTTATRELMIFDLIKKELVFEIVNRDGLEIQDHILYYQAIVTIDDEKKRPICSPEIEALSYKIYLERQGFDFQTLEIIKTGDYTCYFEE